MVEVLNVSFCMTLLILVEDARGDHVEETYSRAGLMTMSVSFCLPHPVAVSAFTICSVACVLVLRYCECVCCV